MRSAAAASVAAALSVCGCGGHAPPALHRPAAAVYCPSFILPPYARKMSQAHHGTWDARALVGLRLDPAERLAERHSCTLRMVGGKDADPDEALTMDLRTDRVDVDVTDGVVVALDGSLGGYVG